MLPSFNDRATRVLRVASRTIHGLFPFLRRQSHRFRGLNFLMGPGLFVRDLIVYLQLPKDPRFPLRPWNVNPCMYDRFDSTFFKRRRSVQQDVWAARKIYESTTPVHYDLGSRMDGLVAICSVFCRVNVFDVRQRSVKDPNIHFIRADYANLGSTPSGSVYSLSSLNLFEHLGLGRYGDPLGVGRLELAASEVKRILAPGGSFYFAVPIGVQRLEFNAHRVFAVATVLEIFEGLELVEFSGIDDADNLHLNANARTFEKSHFSQGLFHFQKPSS